MNDYDRAFREFILPMVNDSRKELLDNVIQYRTRYLTVVLEDIYLPQNASAVLRTCDCFGIQDVTIIENRNAFELNPEVERGAAQWLTLHKFNTKKNNTPDAILSLKEQGYRIVATSPHTSESNLSSFSLEKGKTALVMGTEWEGISKTVQEMADEFLNIPMFGFTESLNLSVSAAIILQQLSTKLRDSEILWRLQESEKEEIMYKWLRNSIHRLNPIERAFKKNYIG